MQAATGWDVSLDELTELSERGLTMARLFNLREGITLADDRLPKRLHEPIRKGPLSDHRITEEQIREEVREYYRERGWTGDAGVPNTGDARTIAPDGAGVCGCAGSLNAD